MDIPAIFILFLVTLLLIRGIQESAFVNNVIVITKVAIVIVVIIIGWGFYQSGEPYAVYSDSHYLTPHRRALRIRSAAFMGILGAAER